MTPIHANQLPHFWPYLSLQFALQQGDVVVMASDGLFDNVWDEQVRGQDNSWICDSVWDEQECIA